MRKWTEIARNPNIEKTPRSKFADEAGSKLYYQSIAKEFLTVNDMPIDKLSTEKLQQLGSEIAENVNSENSPSRATIAKNVADETGSDEISIETVRRKRYHSLFKTLSKQTKQDIIGTYEELSTED